MPVSNLQAFVSLREVQPEPAVQVPGVKEQVAQRRSLVLVVVTEEVVATLATDVTPVRTGVPSKPEMVPV